MSDKKIISYDGIIFGDIVDLMPDTFPPDIFMTKKKEYCPDMENKIIKLDKFLTSTAPDSRYTHGKEFGSQGYWKKLYSRQGRKFPSIADYYHALKKNRANLDDRINEKFRKDFKHYRVITNTSLSEVNPRTVRLVNDCMERINYGFEGHSRIIRSDNMIHHTRIDLINNAIEPEEKSFLQGLFNTKDEDDKIIGNLEEIFHILAKNIFFDIRLPEDHTKQKKNMPVAINMMIDKVYFEFSQNPDWIGVSRGVRYL